MFNECQELEEIPNISGWNTENVESMGFLFCDCQKITKLPDIYKWNMKKVKNLNSMFCHCENVKEFKDIGKWEIGADVHLNEGEGITMEDMFRACRSMEKSPTFENWNFSKVISLAGFFRECESLKQLPENIGKWDISSINNLSYMCANCFELNPISSIMDWQINLRSVPNMFDNVRVDILHYYPLPGNK